MRHRTGLSLALLAIAALSVSASAEGKTHRPEAASSPLDSSSTIATQEYVMSTSASGNAAQVKEQLDRYVSQFGGSGVHHVAADAARAAVEKITGAEKDSATFSISISETVSEASGSLNVYYSVNRPVASSDSSSSSSASLSISPASPASSPSSSAPSASSTPSVPSSTESGASGSGSVQQPTSTGTPESQSGSLTGATVNGSSAPSGSQS